MAVFLSPSRAGRPFVAGPGAEGVPGGDEGRLCVGGRPLPDGLPIGRARNRTPIAASGVDLISSRRITRSAPILDLGVDIASRKDRPAPFCDRLISGTLTAASFA